MANRDWDMVRRRERVAEQGAERSEYSDIVEQIAKAKGLAKVHGTNLTKCPLCDGYYAVGCEDQHRHIRLPYTALKRAKKKRRMGNKAKNLAKGLSMVIRNGSGQIVKRVWLH